MPKDLVTDALGHLPWDEPNADASLKKVHDHAAERAKQAIAWYAASKRPKKMVGLSIRFLAIVLVSLAGLLPLIGELAGETLVVLGLTISLKPLGASLMIGIAAALVGLDRFFGYSSGWMRYVTTGMALNAALDDFEMKWHALRAAAARQEPTPEQVAAMLQHCHDFAARVNTIVAEETSAWVQEFQNSLKQVDEAVKAAEQQASDRLAAERARAEDRARKEAAVSGALKLVIADVGNVKLPWKAQVGEGPERQINGSTAVFGPLPKGRHVVRVFAVVGGEERQNALIADVEAGAITEAEVKL